MPIGTLCVFSDYLDNIPLSYSFGNLKYYTDFHEKFFIPDWSSSSFYNFGLCWAYALPIDIIMEELI